jgi:hypothetical protein
MEGSVMGDMSKKSATDKIISRRRAFKVLLKVGTTGLFACVAASSENASCGKCSKCACIRFKEDYRNNRVCENCGHSYGDNW